MKKITYIIIILIVLFSLSFILMKIFVQTPKINFDNACNSDNDCKLKKIQFSCDCSCNHIVDLGKKEYAGVNENNYYEYYTNWKKENCTENELSQICVCPAIATEFINTQYKAVCDFGQCVKKK